MEKNRNKRSVPYKSYGVERLYYIANTMYRQKRRISSRIVKYFMNICFRCFIDPMTQIGKRLQLPHGGFGVVINGNTTIGDDAIIFHGVTIANGGAKIGDRVYIGTGAIIIGNVIIGDDVTIGAHCLVDFNIPTGSLVVSQRATVIPDSKKPISP